MSEITNQDITTMFYQDGVPTLDKDWEAGTGQKPSENPPVLQAIGRQVSAELRASHQYLAMAAFCERLGFPGAARWFKRQSLEERHHALKLFDFVSAKNAAVELEAVPAPAVEFKDITDVFVAALLQEERTTAQINQLYELAFTSRAFTEMAELHWFLTEQVEEEKTARQWVARFRMVANDPGSLLDLDRELGARSSTP